MNGYEKYKKMYFMPPEDSFDWVKKDAIDKAPIWCSVDLRDGNQALIEPMSLEQKVKFYQMLVKIGFKEIEVGFPAASETEYDFLRTLIDNDMIPDDVTIQVLTQAREHIIKKTFEAIKGAKNVVVHVYNSTSVAQREQVFKKSKEEIKQIAIDGAKLLKDLAEGQEGNISFEYSPESFSGTEVDYAVEVCNAVIDVWEPTPDKKIILNLPTTVQTSMSHVFASQIEYVCKHIHRRDSVVVSLHPHNDRGSGISDAELGLLAGADRIEGTLFGNGERTGNVDIVTLAMNMHSHGVDSRLDFSNMGEIAATYEELTGMEISMRQPYAGELVFTAFSGSHQDAISKGMAYREAGHTNYWEVPYLPIDPKDVGRQYDSDVIRINSQSGKGGVSYVLKQAYGIDVPDMMREELGYAVKHVSDVEHSELTPQQIYDIFKEKFMTPSDKFVLKECHYRQNNGIEADVTMEYNGKELEISGVGNGRLEAVNNALKKNFGYSYELTKYEEHSMTRGASSKAMAFVGITRHEKTVWGVGVDDDIVNASNKALFVVVGNNVAGKQVTRKNAPEK